ncbi:MAG TPA: SusD/RagB family nutrient-binding outer membrane lipoprotein [Gemmatimonadaceae bacterium]|jgi:hypothetical protein|nr:SusD/RagB family nutrient-binding outer membrane lipoprotein [Gemmatimonadaceae bacterium]
MNRYLKAALTAAMPAVVLAGCNDFLKCSECDTNPTSPIAASSEQRLVAVQAATWEEMNGDLARLVSMWMQTMAGTDRQFLSYGTYVIGDGDYESEFSRPYRPALLDLRAIEQDESEKGDQIFLGISQVYHAWLMGTVTDIWGDVPFSQAASPDSFPTPVYDAQQDVYAGVQTLLDNAISNLGGSGTVPLPVDLIYNGDSQSWIELAHTMKARFYLHTAEADPTAYQKALDEAELGISSNAGDYVIPYTANTGSDNNWHQFMIRERAGYVSPGANLIDILTDMGDPRLEAYFVHGDDPEIIGAAPGEKVTGKLAALNPDGRGAQDYQQPLVTYNENLLIKAEALYQTGDEPGALEALNAERAAWGTATSWHPALSLPALTGLSGDALLEAIMTEKYIVLFQNIETWNDYKRTCIPALTPAAGNDVVPGRIPYSATEKQTNGDNVPADPERNWNDPNACPAP